MCEYKLSAEENKVFPRVNWVSECGFKLTVVEGYNMDHKNDSYGKINPPSGKCLKCKEEITALF